MFEERPYQQRIIKKTIDSFLGGTKSILIESPPGSGKTFCGLSILKMMSENSDKLLAKPLNQIKIGWVAMRRNLLKQAEQENTRIGCPNIEYISMFCKKPPKVDVLLLDEGHHSAADSCSNIFNICQPEYVLALTATPYRSDHMKLCFSKVIKDAGFHRLIEDGYLAKFNQWMINEWTVESVTKVFLSNPTHWGRSVIFFHTIDECQRAALELQKAGISCDTVTGMSDRYQQIDNFMDGKLQVLLNVYVLSEGFDADIMQSVFVRDSSKGPTIQAAGRVLRKHPDIPVVNIIQSVNTHYPFIRTAKANRQYLMQDGEWRSVEVSDMVQIMNDMMIKRLINAKTELPELLRTKTTFGPREHIERDI